MISIHQLSYHINQYHILSNVDGAIEPGEVVALVGPNGAGKSTLADIISGFRQPSAGRVLLTGIDITRAKPHVIARQGIARMFQGAHLAWNLTATENVLSSLLDAKHLTSGQMERRELALSLLERVGLLDQKDAVARTLSFGQQRLLALARVLARPAKVLILDEPFSGLKGVALERITTIIMQEMNSGKAILIIDHLLSALRDLRCRFWYLARGRMSSFLSFESLAGSDLFRSGYGASPKWRELLPEQCGPAAGLATPDAICEIVDASLGYNDRAIVTDASLSVERGEILALIGLNGVGKSTLLKAIIGTCEVLKGQVRIRGEDVALLPVYKRIQDGIRVLPQDHRLFRTLSVNANQKLAQAGFRGNTESKDLADVKAEFGNRVAGTLSGGEQARIALDLLNIGIWSIVLLDEPTTGIDNKAKEDLYSKLKSWRHAGKTILFVEHDFEFVVQAASEVRIVTPDGLVEVRLSDIDTGRDLLERVLVVSVSFGGK
jgi:ABC-type branched-subunit amino acid transport system ATPase component